MMQISNISSVDVVVVVVGFNIVDEFYRKARSYRDFRPARARKCQSVSRSASQSVSQTKPVGGPRVMMNEHFVGAHQSTKWRSRPRTILGRASRALGPASESGGARKILF